MNLDRTGEMSFKTSVLMAKPTYYSPREQALSAEIAGVLVVESVFVVQRACGNQLLACSLETTAYHDDAMRSSSTCQ